MRKNRAGSALALFVFIVLISLAFAGCAARGADFTTVYGTEGAFGYKESGEGITYGVSAIARSLDELKELCAEWNNPAFTEGAEGYDGELSRKLRAYDDGFFSEKSLVIVFHFDVNGAREPRLPGNVNVCFEGIEGEGILLLLDAKGICASSGSACTSGSLDPSHVLLAIGRPHEIAHGSLRLSISEETTEADVDAIIQATKETVATLRSMSPVWRDLQEGKRQYVIQ